MSEAKLRGTTVLFGVLALWYIASVNLTPVFVQMVLSLSCETVFSLASTAWFRAVDLVGEVDGGEMSF